MKIDNLIKTIKNKQAKYYSYNTHPLCQSQLVMACKEEFHRVAHITDINHLENLNNKEPYDIVIVQNTQNIIVNPSAQEYLKKLIRQNGKSLLIFFEKSPASKRVFMDYHTDNQWSNILEKSGLYYEDFQCSSDANESDIEDENEIETQNHRFLRAIFTIPIHKISTKYLLLFLSILAVSVVSFFQYTEIPIIWKTIFSALSTILGSLIANMIWNQISREKIFQ